MTEVQKIEATKGVMAPKENPDDAVEQATAKLRRTCYEMALGLGEVINRDETALKCCMVMLICHRLQLWAKSELAERDGILDGFVDFADEVMGSKVWTDNGFRLQDLESELTGMVLPFMRERLEYYRQENGIRQGNRSHERKPL